MPPRSKIQPIFVTALALVWLAVNPGWLHAQRMQPGGDVAHGDITLIVTVLDSASKPVTGAAVRVAPSGRNLQDGTTGRDGVVKFSVPRGTIRSIDVTASGYQPATMTNLQATSSPATSFRISIKPLVQTVVVPDVVGKTSQDAENILKGKGLVCKLIMDIANAAVPGWQNLPIIVQSQRPAAGASVAPGTAVNLTCVSRRK
jgi:hypothetical protein